MAAPTPNTRKVAHAAVGIAGGAAASKILGSRGSLVFLVSALFLVMLHDALDAPVAKGMAEIGLQF